MDNDDVNKAKSEISVKEKHDVTSESESGSQAKPDSIVSTYMDNISDVRTHHYNNNDTSTIIRDEISNHNKRTRSKKSTKDTKSKRTYDLSKILTHVRTNADKIIGSGKIPNMK